MEWFRTIQPAIAESDIRRLCTVSALPDLCGDVYEITQRPDDKEPAEISCVWGLFATNVEPIRNGVRYALITCPNALQWTITTRNGETTVHCSINDAHPDTDFAASIETFMDKFRDGLIEAATI